MIGETIALLEANKAAAGLKLVGGAADFDVAARGNPAGVPAAFVIPQREHGGPSPMLGRTRQPVSASFGVVLVVRNVSDGKGSAAATDISALRAAVRNLLLGWSPANCNPVEFESGQLLAFRDGYLWWSDVYRTKFTVSSA